MKRKNYVIAFLIGLATFAVMGFVSSYTYSTSLSLNEQSGPGIKIQSLFTEPEGSICLALPYEYFETGLPFVTKKGTRDCGTIELNPLASLLNIVVNLLVSFVVAGLYLWHWRTRPKKSNVNPRG